MPAPLLERTLMDVRQRPMNMRLSFAVLCVLFCGLAASPADTPADTPANRLAAAREYLKAAPPAEMIESTVAQLASRLPENRREEFRKALAKVLSSEHLEEITLRAIVKHFTVREIKALTAFYGSPEGRSISKKFAAYMSDVMPAIQQEVNEALEELEHGRP